MYKTISSLQEGTYSIGTLALGQRTLTVVVNTQDAPIYGWYYTNVAQKKMRILDPSQQVELLEEDVVSTKPIV